MRDSFAHYLDSLLFFAFSLLSDKEHEHFNRGISRIVADDDFLLLLRLQSHMSFYSVDCAREFFRRVHKHRIAQQFNVCASPRGT